MQLLPYYQMEGFDPDAWKSGWRGIPLSNCQISSCGLNTKRKVYLTVTMPLEKVKSILASQYLRCGFHCLHFVRRSPNFVVVLGFPPSVASRLVIIIPSHFCWKGSVWHTARQQKIRPCQKREQGRVGSRPCRRSQSLFDNEGFDSCWRVCPSMRIFCSYSKRKHALGLLASSCIRTSTAGNLLEALSRSLTFIFRVLLLFCDIELLRTRGLWREVERQHIVDV